MNADEKRGRRVAIGEVELNTGRLLRESVRVIDERDAGKRPLLEPASFSVHEDRETGEIVANLTRIFHTPAGRGEERAGAERKAAARR